MHVTLDDNVPNQLSRGVFADENGSNTFKTKPLLWLIKTRSLAVVLLFLAVLINVFC